MSAPSEPGQVQITPINSTPLKTAPMTPASQTQGVRVDADVLYLDDIPKAMDRMGWTVSAKLMRRWFETKPAYVMPREIRGGVISGVDIDYERLAPSQVDHQTVKMKWMLGFARAVQPFEDLCQTWNSVKGTERLKRRLETAGWSPGKSTRLVSRHVCHAA
ncbi:MAG: hypothetical protein EON54_24950 [Alcaligenaceae bacterium]|nr:MAG: hypothetical protein EON54_24950 [Alcaligenaceae bacterium]